ncbi:MAG: chromosomal replication initiator protein DnaA, partial [Actinomycetota bacterium]
MWQSTFAPASPVRLSDDLFVLGLPNGIIRDKLDGRYRPLVEDAVCEAAGQDIKVVFELVLPTLFDDDLNPSRQAEYEPDATSPGHTAANGTDGVADPGTRPAFGHHPMPGALDGNGAVGPMPVPGAADDQRHRYTFDGFVIGPSNRFAHAAALSVAERPGGSYNPLFIYGSAGLGKTHILRAIEHFVNDVYPRLKVLYVSTETFLNEFVDSIKNSSGNDFKRRYRQIDVLLIDDIQFIEGKDSLQEELFHTFNDLYGANRQIVLSSDRPPDAIPTLEERLKSRFMMGLLTDVQPPDIETRMAILRKKADRDGHYLPNEVSEFIATNITTNIRELEGALNKVTAFATLNGQSMTKAVAEQVLGDFIADHQPRPITVSMILDATVQQFGHGLGHRLTVEG